MKVVCVMRSGGQYDISHVHRLRTMIPSEYAMECLTDTPSYVSGVKMTRLRHDFDGWWSKIELFHPDNGDESTVYMDLDVDVVGDVMPLFRNDFTAYEDVLRPDNMNSSVMSWINPPHEIYETFMSDPNKYIQQFRRWPNLGDQAFIQSVVKPDFYESGLVRSYRKECYEGVPVGTRVVVYHGRPKPWEVTM